jgi:hypothetical protein
MLFSAEPDDTGIRPLIDAPLCCLDHDLMQKSLGVANRGPAPTRGIKVPRETVNGQGGNKCSRHGGGGTGGGDGWTEGARFHDIVWNRP